MVIFIKSDRFISEIGDALPLPVFHQGHSSILKITFSKMTKLFVGEKLVKSFITIELKGKIILVVKFSAFILAHLINTAGCSHASKGGGQVNGKLVFKPRSLEVLDQLFCVCRLYRLRQIKVNLLAEVLEIISRPKGEGRKKQKDGEN